MRNFDYLKEIAEQIPALEPLYTRCALVEEQQSSDPTSAALQARVGLELLVRDLYRMKNVAIDERDSLYQLVSNPIFTEFIADADLMMAVHWIRKVGNQAAHKGSVSRSDAFFSAMNLYNVVGGVLMRLRVLRTLAPFDPDLLPQNATPPVDRPATPAATPAAGVTARPSEAETRRRFIDLMLREAGWEVLTTKGAQAPSKAGIEIKVTGMPNGSGTGFVDYVLYGADGKPLALVEAKSTCVDPGRGKHQAELYADCLQRQYGERPVIYYTNGFDTYVIDGLGYPQRRIYAFHTQRDLEVLRSHLGHTTLTQMQVDANIAGRYYQTAAITAVGQWFNRMNRRALLVMATGTGKTRTAIGLVDLLMRNGRVRDVLFLADRTALVNQAARNFQKLMPALSTTILSDGTAEPDPTARLTFSTYQTMIRHIDTEDKTFSVGRFDLIIIDEAHRSIFGKYRVILDYFDALVVGLTATPRDQIDRSTYDLLQVEGGCPTYCYEYDTAVSDGFLVDYHGFIRESQIMNQGIRYSQLTAEEKEEMEAIWDYEQARIDPSQPSQARDILSNEMYNYIFNTDTVDRMLQDLMEHGLKVQSGERIGKTIIFALNSATARLIVERFTKLYPHLGADFCVQIDYSVRYGQDLIAHFSDRDREPQIAVSVDMLDTGIDVPDVLNLVFFKRVRSRIKFLQMIGRGTRLSPGVFGPGQDKTCFNIYDWGGNFHYFEKNPKEVAQAVVTTLTERLFAVRTDIAYALQEPKYQEDKFARSLHDRLKEMLQADVRALSDDFITVRTRWETVTKYRNPAVWTSLAPTDVWALKRDIAPLVVGTSDNEAIKKFDLLALYTELGLLDASFTTTSYEQQIITIAHCLVRRTSIPAIAGKIGLLREVQTQEFWAAKSLPTLEHMREELRELMVYLEREELRIFTVDIHDTVLDDGQAGPIVTTMSYRQSVLDYLTEHADWPVLQKIKNLERLTQADMRELEHILWEELGTEADYKSYLQQEGLQLNSSAAMLIRKLAGVDRTKAISLFTEYIHVNKLNAEQMEFLKSILDYVCQNGDMERKDLIDNQTIRTSMLRIFPDGVKEVGDFIQRIHEAIEVVA